MSNKKVNAKREAYAKKEEEKGKKVVMWIIGLLIVLGVFFSIWASGVMA
jgi:hypothetical protein